MKTLIPSTGKNLDSLVDPRFGRAPFFLIVNSETQEFEVMVNSGVGFSRGAGVSSAQMAADKKVEAIITGNIGPNAFMVLSQAGIKIFTGAFNMTCQQSLDLFNQGKLARATAPIRPSFGQEPRGGGREPLGQGGGRGQGGII